MRNLVLAFAILFSSISFGQNNVFVLIDCSGNPLDLAPDKMITPSMREEALDIVRDIIVANFNKQNYSNWEQRGLQGELKSIYEGRGQPLLSQNGYIVIIPYGERNTYQNFRIDKIQKYPDDFYSLYKYAYELEYNDQYTFEDIAIGKAADIANDPDVDIGNYYLINIKGLGKDTDSKPYTEEELEYINNYVADSEAMGKLKYSSPDIQYSIIIDKIDISKMSHSQKIVGPKHVTRKLLEIKFPRGTDKTPYLVEEGKAFLVSWSCLGCDDSVNYKVIIRGDKTITKNTKNNKISLLLEPGNYRIDISGDNIRSKEPLYVKVKKEKSYGFLIFLLVLALLIGLFLLIRRWKKGRDAGKSGSGEKGNKDDKSLFHERDTKPDPTNNEAPSFD